MGEESLDVSALYLLAAPSTPDEVREAVMPALSAITMVKTIAPSFFILLCVGTIWLSPP
jgi:hypothetical protein